MEKPKLLIIDDDEALCESLVDIIELEGYVTETAHTAKDGIKKVKSGFYNIVLLDMKLPDSGGIEVLEKIREISSDTEVIMFTAYANMDTVIKAMDRNAFSFLPKPLDIPYLLKSIKRALEKQMIVLENRNLFDQVMEGRNDWEITFDSISDLISIHDVDSKIIRLNKALADRLNAKPGDIIGEKCYKIFHGCNEPLPGCAILKCIETLKPTEEETECMGGVFLMSCFPRFDRSGKFNGIVHIARDITERKQIEEALKVSEEKFRTISVTANDAIIMIDNDEFILFWNAAAERLFGLAKEEVIGKKIHETIIPDNFRADHIKGFKAFRDTGQGPIVGQTVELNAIKKDGTEFPMELSLSAVKIDGKWNAIGIIRDITERKQAEQQIKQGLDKLRITLDGVINALALTVEQRDPYTAGHQQRVSKLARAIAEEIGLPKDQIEGIHMAGVIHDIGKMHIPSEILSRPGKLTKDEFNIVKSHAQVGYDILKDIEFPWPVADIVHQHHEKIDGSGYPLGLTDGDIIKEARVLCVADVVEAMASHRPYRPALGIVKALEEISRGKGVQYDPDVVDACLKVIKEKGFKFENQTDKM